MKFHINLSHTVLFSTAVLLGTSLVACSKPADQPAESAASTTDTTADKSLDKITLTTSWYAQAEHGGFYQAQAEGIYKKYGLDVTIAQGGPQVNGMTLLMSKKSDIIVSYDIQTLKAVEQGMPAVAIGTSFQVDPQGLLTHENVNSFADLKDKTILVSTSGQTSWWPWLKQKYNLSEDQVRPYTFNLQPFLADKNTVQQSYATSEVLPATQANPKVKFFLFADDGYPAYGGILVSRQDLVDSKPDVLKRFMQASSEGWKSYMNNPAPANAIIKKENPQMTDEVLDFSLNGMKERGFIDGSDAKTMGIGVITAERWKKTRDMMVSTGLLKADTPWEKSFTLKFVAPETELAK